MGRSFIVGVVLQAVCLSWTITATTAQSLPEGPFVQTIISPTVGGPDRFGASVAALGDVNGDGVQDLAVGAPDFDASPSEDSVGAVWIYLLNSDATVASAWQITQGSGMGGEPDENDRFGSSVAALGDVSGDGVPDLAVGAPGDDSAGCLDCGAVWILHLFPDGSVKRAIKIDTTSPAFERAFAGGERFGSSVTGLGDVDGDGVDDLAVGAPGTDDDEGAVWVLFLDADGVVARTQPIGEGQGGFLNMLRPDDRFGGAVAGLGDQDGDGVPDLAVGASGIGVADRGAVWILFLDVAGRVIAQTRISADAGGFTGPLNIHAEFGAALTALGDVDGDGVGDLAVGSPGYAGVADGFGAAWLLQLARDGTVLAHEEISDQAGTLVGDPDILHEFGASVAWIDGLVGPGCRLLLVGAPGAPPDGGEVWVLYLRAGSWTSVGGGLPGSGGVPGLSGKGTLCGGDPVSLTVASGPHGTGFALVLGGTALNAPFHGGTMVPFPDIVVVGQLDVFDPFVIEGLWPVGVPAGATLYAQAWVHDSDGPADFAASNAIAATAP